MVLNMVLEVKNQGLSASQTDALDIELLYVDVTSDWVLDLKIFKFFLTGGSNTLLFTESG